MAITWPSNLQQYLSQDSFSYEFGETTIKTQMDIGPVKVRRRSTRPIDTVQGSIIVTAGEFSAFELFYNTTTSGGSLPFEALHPITGATSTFRFKAAPSVRNLGGLSFVISLDWEKIS